MTEIFNDYEVKNLSTFKIGGCIKKAAFPDNLTDLIELLKTDEYDLVLGNCSNVLFSSEYIDKKIIFTKNITQYFINGRNINISCGTNGALIAKECKERCLSGFEFLIGFPGSFGGMIYMNASAHKQSISDCFSNANVFDIANKTIINLKKEEMNFSYRHSVLSEKKYILLDANFELKNGEKEQINDLMERNLLFRKQYQPSLKYGNAGSIFKNPDNDSAGRLLDLSHMKGVSENDALVYEKHANFIINTGDATSLDVIKLMYKMYTSVKEKYTIRLKPEIKYIGNYGTEEYKLWEIMIEDLTNQPK